MPGTFPRAADNWHEREHKAVLNSGLERGLVSAERANAELVLDRAREERAPRRPGQVLRAALRPAARREPRAGRPAGLTPLPGGPAPRPSMSGAREVGNRRALSRTSLGLARGGFVTSRPRAGLHCSDESGRADRKRYYRKPT